MSGTGPEPMVGVIMGSDSDWPVLGDAVQVLVDFDVPHEVAVVSAHRTPARMLDYASTAADRGLRVSSRAPVVRPTCRAWWRRPPRCR